MDVLLLLGYGGQLTTQAQRVGTGQQQPYSPHSQMASPLSQQGFTQTTTVSSFPNPGQRLSPQSQFNAQLSPRQAYPQTNSQNATWQQQAQVRLTMQQNPMLTAQLTVSFVNGCHSYLQKTWHLISFKILSL